MPCLAVGQIRPETPRNAEALPSLAIRGSSARQDALRRGEEMSFNHEDTKTFSTAFRLQEFQPVGLFCKAGKEVNAWLRVFVPSWFNLFVFYSAISASPAYSRAVEFCF
jgi:hypothetical protein